MSAKFPRGGSRTFFSSKSHRADRRQLTYVFLISCDEFNVFLGEGNNKHSTAMMW